MGGLVDRGLRWVLKWGLSHALGPAGLGLFELAQKIGSTVTSFSPLGLDTGVIYFAARQRKGGDRAALKGTLHAGGALALGVGLLAGVLLFVLAPWLADAPDAVEALRWMAPVVVVWTPLLFAVGALRAVKDMRRSVLAFQIILPCVLIAGTGLAVGVLGAGVPGAIAAMGVATLLALVVAARFAWRHYADVLSDGTLQPRFEVGQLLKFSIPQSLTAAAFRLNLYMDVLMLGLLATREDVGIYAIAASLASFGSVPANAVVSIFNPFIAELVYSGERQRLDRLLKTVTRWLVIVAVPVYLLLLLLPDLVLSVYSDAFATAAVPLVVLTVGQAINTACAPTMRLIPMSGHAMLNLVNGVVALALNVVLNWFLIPEHGALGAACATGLTLAAWSLWRVAEVWFLLRCFPFGWRSLGLLLLSAIGGAGLLWAGEDWALGVRIGAAAGLGVGFLGVSAFLARTPEDRAVLDRVAGRIRRLLGRP